MKHNKANIQTSKHRDIFVIAQQAPQSLILNAYCQITNDTSIDVVPPCYRRTFTHISPLHNQQQTTYTNNNNNIYIL